MIIYAVNIHTGGGKVLLDEIILNEPFGPIQAVFLDHRYEAPQKMPYKVFRSNSQIWGRVKTEFNLHRLVRLSPKWSTEEILFFGNLPPVLKPRLRSMLYLQNCFLTRQVPLPKDTLQEMLRNWIESVFLKIFAKNVDEIWVQTPWMKTMTEVYLPAAKISLKPFLPTWNFQPEAGKNRIYNFIYVGSASLNKRFDFFLAALGRLDLLLKDVITVYIALDAGQPIQVREDFNKIKIEIHFRVSRDELARAYSLSENFVATGRYESFCLPLYEAHAFDCRVLAPRAGYTENLAFEALLYDAESPEDLSQKMLALSQK